MNTDSNSHLNYALRALESFAGYGDREALVRRDRRFTYAQLRTVTMNMAVNLHEQGVRAGMAVAVLVERPVEAPVIQLALHVLGARSVWIDLDGPRRDLGDYLRLVRPEVLLYDARTQESFGRELTERLGIPTVCLGPGGAGADVLRPNARPFDPGWAGAEPESVFQTSGTTGVPKLVHHRQGFYAQVLTLADELVAAGERDVRHLSISGLSYLAGQISALIYLFSGATLVLLEGFEPVEFLATLERERISSTFVSPPVLYTLLDSPMLDSTDLSSLRLLSVGAAPATTSRLRRAIRRFGPIVRITYGLSECPFISAFPGVAEDPQRPKALESCGRPYGDVLLEIRGEDGAALGTGEVGEVWVSSALNFAGYWGQPELTEQALVDGWVRTRDLGYLDADGFLYLVGRTSDMIIIGRYSEKIFPRPIEDTLTSHPQVHAAAVIGVPDPEFGEAAHAYVVTAPGATVSATELARLVGAELTKEWVPATIEFVDSLPLTAIGKVNTSALRARHAAEHSPAEAGSPA